MNDANEILVENMSKAEVNVKVSIANCRKTRNKRVAHGLQRCSKFKFRASTAEAGRLLTSAPAYTR